MEVEAFRLHMILKMTGHGESRYNTSCNRSQLIEVLQPKANDRRSKGAEKRAKLQPWLEKPLLPSSIFFWMERFISNTCYPLTL